MYNFDQWQKCTVWQDRSCDEINAVLFPKPSDRALDKDLRERLHATRIIITEAPPPPKERSIHEMMALLFPGRRAQAPAENVSLFVERRRRAR